MKITIRGQVPSLKNSKQIFKNSRTGASFITSSVASKDWVKDATRQLGAVKELTAYPVGVVMVFYFKGKHRKDLDNAASSVLDVLRSDYRKGLLVREGYLKDDDWQHVSDLTISFGGIDKTNPRVEVFIDE